MYLNCDKIHSRVEAQALNNPFAIAAISGLEQLTYDELNQRANQLAHYLQALGVKNEQRVALCMPPSIDVLVAMLGILKAGAAYVPIDPSLPTSRLLFIINDCDAAAIITQSDVKLELLTSHCPLILMDDADEISTGSTCNLNLDIKPEQLAYVIYTSGTTGNPKGVLIEHRSVINYGDWFAAYSFAQFQTRIDWSSHYMFDMAVTTTIVPLMHGLTIVICGEKTHRDFREYLLHIKASRAQILKMTPTYFKELLREVNHQFIDLPNLQRIILGGEPLRADDCQQWLSHYPNHTLINEYGPTEATVAFSHYAVMKETHLSCNRHVLIGKPGLNMYFYILDAFKQTVTPGVEGELYIGGAGLARGYMNLPELTNACFIQDPFRKNERVYKTGDRCRLQPDGSIEYLDRLDRQVKIRGFRVELNEMEQCLHAHPALEDVAVIVKKNEQQDLLLIAYYIEKNSTHALTHDEMRQYMLRSLPNYMIPNFFIQMNAFPMGANGKLDYGMLPNHTQSIAPSAQIHSHLEQSLIQIWSNELGLSSVGVDDGFWELGGHSIIAVRIVMKINQRLGKNITERELYQAMTIRQLALVLQKNTNEPNPLKNPTTRPAGAYFSLSHFQTILWASKTFKPKASKLNIVARKRFHGALDIDRLQMAFERVVESHPILSYKMLKSMPIQGGVHAKTVSIHSVNMQGLPDHETDRFLQQSMDEAIDCSSWNKRAALVKATLFYLKNDEIELQLAMPHIISDGRSMDILFSELSFFYLNAHHHPNSIERAEVSAPFSEYVCEEQRLVQQNKAIDHAFWSEYLQDAHLFTFQSKYIPSQNAHGSYSTYVPIPDKTMHHLEAFCRHQHIHFSDALCATLGLSLKTCSKEHDAFERPVLIHMVKSSRDQLKYSDTIGCFLRVEPVKLWLHSQQTLLSLARQVHDFFAQHKKTLQGSSILKLAALNPFYRKKKNAAYYGMKCFVFMYTRFMRTLNINHDVLTLCPELSLLDTKNHFMIYLNIWNNFVHSDADEKELFGLKPKPMKMYQYDLLAMDYIVEVCFLRDTDSNQAYVVISTNLDPDFRKRIAHEIIRMMDEDMAIDDRIAIPCPII